MLSIPFSLGYRFIKPTKTLCRKQAQQPYLLVRQNGDSVLYGLLHRNVFYHLLNFGEFSVKMNKVRPYTCKKWRDSL